MSVNSTAAVVLHGDPRLGRLRWRSRRGMKELDALFEAYFSDIDLSDCDETCITALERLLDCQDTDLLAWLLGHSLPQDAQLQGVVRQIRASPKAVQQSI